MAHGTSFVAGESQAQARVEEMDQVTVREGHSSFLGFQIAAYLPTLQTSLGVLITAGRLRELQKAEL